ncbi:hypothetical protein VKT23_017973 [Stygiomarasmius scandens]|uniref:Uncharacterized protein n=1 Tax=Marasmiellus scandens TaxID=2682957 RepID=A0ABR1IUS5_9AGAR
MQLLSKVFLVAAVLSSAASYSAAQFCNTRDDCPGSDVCCGTNVNRFCIPFDQCVNIGADGFGQCAAGPSGFGGRCD